MILILMEMMSRPQTVCNAVNKAVEEKEECGHHCMATAHPYVRQAKFSSRHACILALPMTTSYTLRRPEGPKLWEPHNYLTASEIVFSLPQAGKLQLRQKRAAGSMWSLISRGAGTAAQRTAKGIDTCTASVRPQQPNRLPVTLRRVSSEEVTLYTCNPVLQTSHPAVR